MRLGQWGHLGVYAVGKRSKSRYQLYDCEAPLINDASYNTHLHHTLQFKYKKTFCKADIDPGEGGSLQHTLITYHYGVRMGLLTTGQEVLGP